MSLTDTFTATYTASTVGSRAFATGKTIPVGQLLAIAVTVNGSVGNITASDSLGNTYVTKIQGVQSGGVISTALIVCRVTNQIGGANNITINLNGDTANRFAVAMGWFDDVVGPINSVQSAATSAATSSISSGSTGALATARKLVLAAVGITPSNAPVTPTGGATLVSQVSTAAGSTDRHVALQYEYETSSSHTATANLNSGGNSIMMASAMDATLPPASDIGSTASDDVMDGLIIAGFNSGSLRDRQMAQHVAAGRTTGSYKDRCVTAGSLQFPK